MFCYKIIMMQKHYYRLLTVSMVIDNYYSLALPEVVERGTFKSHSNPPGGSCESCMHICTGPLLSFTMNVLIVKVKTAPARVYYDNKGCITIKFPCNETHFHHHLL